MISRVPVRRRRTSDFTTLVAPTRSGIRARSWALWLAIASIVVSAQPAILTASGAQSASGDLALASAITVGDELVVGGGPIKVGVEGEPQTISVTFGATAGQRVAVQGESLDESSWVGLRLLSPSDDVLGENQGWSPVFVEPVTLTAAGTYTVEVDTGYGQVSLQVSPVSADVTDVIEAATDPVPWNHRFAPGEKALLDMDLDAGQRVFITTATQFDGDGYGHPDFGNGTVDMTLLDPLGNVVATQGSYAGEASLEFETSETGTYQLAFDPTRDAAGHLSLSGFDVSQPASGTLAVGGGPSRVVATAPGQMLELEFIAVEGQRLRARTEMRVGGFSLEILGPDGEQVTESWGGQFPTFVAPETGTYRMVSTTGIHLDQLRAWVDQAPLPPVTELTIDGPARVASIVGEGEVQFHVSSDPSQRVKVIVKADSGVGGLAELRDETGDVLDYAAVDDVSGARLLSDLNGGEYTVWVTGSEGAVSARARSANEPSSIVITPDGGPVSMMTEAGYTYAEVDLEEGTDYRIRVTPTDTPEDTSQRFSLYASSLDTWWNVLDFSETSRDDVWTFTAEGDGTYGMSLDTWLPHSSAQVEVYREVGTPQVDIERGSPDLEGGVNVHADWTTDAAGVIAGYAVTVDEQDDTDPGTAITQQVPSLVTLLTPGQHWLHVRAIDADGNYGAVAHRRIRVAPELVTAALGAADVTPGSPGFATTDTPTLNVAVPAGSVDAQVRFIIRSQGRWTDSFEVPVADNAVEWTVPAHTLKSGTTYEVTAQLLDADGDWARPALQCPSRSMLWLPRSTLRPA